MNQSASPLTVKGTGGTAFTYKAAKWSGLKSDFYHHFTLTHTTTQDQKIVKLVRKAIIAYVTTEVPLNHRPCRSNNRKKTP